jgi:serine/threonine protein kinase
MTIAELRSRSLDSLTERGMREVFRARDSRLGRDVAIKFLKVLTI